MRGIDTTVEPGAGLLEESEEAHFQRADLAVGELPDDNPELWPVE